MPAALGPQAEDATGGNVKLVSAHDEESHEHHQLGNDLDGFDYVQALKQEVESEKLNMARLPRDQEDDEAERQAVEYEKNA